MNTFKQFFNVVSTENNDCNLDTISNDYRSNSIALVEASAEQDALIQESNVVDDTIEKVEEDVSDIKETLDTNDANMATGGEDQITPAEVAIATQALELRLERLGLNLRDLSSSANISRETFISRENGGLGLKPSDVLRNLHHDMSKEDGILSKIAAGARAVWKAICDMARKIADFVINLFRSQKSIMDKLLTEINKNMSLPGGSRNIEFNFYNVAPAHYIFGPSKSPILVGHSATSTSVDLVKNCIDTANEIIKKV